MVVRLALSVLVVGILFIVCCCPAVHAYNKYMKACGKQVRGGYDVRSRSSSLGLFNFGKDGAGSGGKKIGSNSVMVEFKVGKDPSQADSKVVEAQIGEPLGNVASRADINIKYKCKKGECGTCEVNVGGKWTKTCQTMVPPMPAGEAYTVSVREKPKEEKKAAFFSPKSLVDGFTANALGALAFVDTARKADDEFEVRMRKENELKAKVAAAKAAKDKK